MKNYRGLTMRKNQKRNVKGGQFGNGKKSIHDTELYEMFRYLEKCKTKVINLKSDLKRDCITYYKYDEFIEDLDLYQKVLIEKDKLKELT